MAFANVGGLDRIVRLALGAAAAGAPFYLNIEPASPVGIGAIAVGVILIATSAISFCPIYGLLGLRTK
ncbi:MAG: DUF2892 domain-containing protein [Pseudomonadota bacterium]